MGRINIFIGIHKNLHALEWDYLQRNSLNTNFVFNKHIAKSTKNKLLRHNLKLIFTFTKIEWVIVTDSTLKS